MLAIGEVARRAGLRTSALRYYEEVGILPPAARVNGQRRYDETILARLAVVRLAQEVGFSVAEIRALVEGFDDRGVTSERWRSLATRKLAETDALIAHAERMKQVLIEGLQCGCLTLDACAMVQPESTTSTESAPVQFELIDLASGNVVNDFVDVAEALESVRRIAENHGWETVQNLALLRLEGDDQALVAMQASLVDLAASMERATAASRMQ